MDRSFHENKALNKPSEPRIYSSQVLDGDDRAPSRAMLRAVGFEDQDFKKPLIGVASTWGKVTPCNMHLNKLSVGQQQRISILRSVINMPKIKI